jgi:hypothetical protein
LGELESLEAGEVREAAIEIPVGLDTSTGGERQWSLEGEASEGIIIELAN